MLRITNLRKKYTTADGDITALDGVSLRVRASEFVAVVGRSGSGKTTLLNMIAGLDNPDGGEIIFRGGDITKMSANMTAELRRRDIGVIYQFYNLVPELTVRENITLPTELDGGAIDEGWLSEILAVVGLTGRESAYPNMLSGGQQQRVAIARALYNKPSLILADEPTGNLDSENGAEVLRLLCEMNAERGVTVIVVTHSDDVAKKARRVITIRNGKVAEDKTQEDVR